MGQMPFQVMLFAHSSMVSTEVDPIVQTTFGRI
jgi:hypothetical protein